MPTINQLVRNKRKDKIKKETAEAHDQAEKTE